MEAYLAAGNLSGPAGKIPAMVLQVLTAGITQDQGYLLIVIQVLSTADVDAYSVSTRIAAGVRVVNSATGKSVPLSEMQGSPRLWGFTSDLATLYCGCNGDGLGSGVDLECVKRKYALYDICVKDAERELQICAIAVMAAWSLCMAGCALGIIFGPLSVFVVAVCVGTWMRGQVIGLATCTAVYLSKLRTCKETLRVELTECGVQLVEH